METKGKEPPKAKPRGRKPAAAKADAKVQCISAPEEPAASATDITPEALEQALIPIKNGLPPFMQGAPLLRRTKVGRRGLASYQEGMLLLFSPALLPEYFQALLQGVKDRDPQAMKLVAEMYNYVQPKGGGISITNNMIQNSMGPSQDRGFDVIMRSLADKKTIDI